jgi:hypothetical protein
MRNKKYKPVLIAFLIFLSSLETYGQTITTDTFKITKITKKVGDIQVNISQYKCLIQSPDIPYCKSYIEIIKNNKTINSLGFPSIEPVGGDYGFLVYSQLINNHLIISKYGDYDGRTIIINEKGKMFNTIGGYSFIDALNGLLFSIYDSDLSGLSVFDLESDVEIFKLVDIVERPSEFYKDANGRYYFQAINDETEKESIWEIMLNNKKIKKTEININILKDKKLKKLIDYHKINIACE